jgi:transcriptional regulator with XRE-family HTH domain
MNGAERRGAGKASARARFARFVRRWLDVTRCPLKRVAAELGVAESAVSQWANGRRFPKIEQLEAFSQLSAVPLPCLLCERNAECSDWAAGGCHGPEPLHAE